MGRRGLKPPLDGWRSAEERARRALDAKRSRIETAYYRREHPERGAPKFKRGHEDFGAPVVPPRPHPKDKTALYKMRSQNRGWANRSGPVKVRQLSTEEREMLGIQAPIGEKGAPLGP